MKKKVFLMFILVFSMFFLVSCLNESETYYLVKFLNMDERVIKEEKVLEGESAIAPTAPTVEGYEFIGWDTDFSNIKSDLTIKAVYKKIIKYTVTFLSMEETVLKEVEVLDGENVTAPTVPTVEGYEFVGWDTDFSNIKSDLTIKAVYKKIIKYTVTFLSMDETVLKEIEVLEGESVTAPLIPTVEGYEFVGWDTDFSNIKSDLTIKALYEIKTYQVSFMSFDELIKEEDVEYLKDATAPKVSKVGYLFLGWDKEFLNIQEDIVVYALWEKIIHASYVSEFNFLNYQDYESLLANIENEGNLVNTIYNVKYGGSRGTNELVYYDESLNHNTNIYGLEVAINKNGLLEDKATKIDIPEGGFVLSAHGTSINFLDGLKIGDYITYNQITKEVKVYRNPEVNSIISLIISLDVVKEKIIEADNNMLALDYIKIEETFNEVINISNELLNNYTVKKYNEASELLLTIDFLLIEPTSTTVRAMWHYPLRSPGFSESNTYEVRRYLDEVKKLGINRIYVNTNFNGSSIYKSEYLTQRLTAYNKYEGYVDYLEAFITEAHLRDIEVYAWTNTLIAGDGMNNPFYSSRGWLLKGFNNEDNYNRMYYLDISNDEVQDFLKDVFNELAENYNLDGIEYDFIRYPVGNLHNYNGGSTSNIIDWGYTESFLNKFKAKYNLEGDIKDLIISDDHIRSNWLQFKRDILSDTVSMLTNEIRNTNSNIKISAAVMTNITTAKNTYLQDWEFWIKSGLIDELNPMIYTADNAGLKSQLINMLNVVEDYALVVAGIFPQGSGGGFSMVAEQISIIESLNVSGVSKFSSRQIFGTNLEKAFKALNRHYIVLPSSSKEDIYEAYIFNLKEKVEGYYIYKTDDSNLEALITIINNFEEEASIEERLLVINNILKLLSDETIKSRLLKEHEKINSKI